MLRRVGLTEQRPGLRSASAAGPGDRGGGGAARDRDDAELEQLLRQARGDAGPGAAPRLAGFPGTPTPDHPVQERMLQEVARWTGVPAEKLLQAVDGCTTVCFGLPIEAMALAYARFGASNEARAARLRTAMTAAPELVAGTGRACTDIMAACPGRLVAKIGADGIYCAALLAALGIALKVEDGDMRALRWRCSGCCGRSTGS